METIAKQNLCWKRVFALIKEAQHNISCKLSPVLLYILCHKKDWIDIIIIILHV